MTAPERCCTENQHPTAIFQEVPEEAETTPNAMPGVLGRMIDDIPKVADCPTAPEQRGAEKDNSNARDRSAHRR